MATPTVEESLARIAAAFERIAAALEDGKAVTPAPQAQQAKAVEPGR